ncbi:MAG: hypothetical protein MJE68_01400 [Proteobacteria bacterium]|nr:hypothetical protein [Pseudomonadota bacterium]
MQLHERPRRELSDEERESMIQEMEDIRKEMMRITKEKFEYQRDVNRSVSPLLSSPPPPPRSLPVSPVPYADKYMYK